MPYQIKPTQKQIDSLLEECSESEDAGSTKYPGMTYEQGLKHGIEWLLEGGDSPLSE
jgi:hypothetical protein